jgi:hypothetical protein
MHEVVPLSDSTHRRPQGKLQPIVKGIRHKEVSIKHLLIKEAEKMFPTVQAKLLLDTAARTNMK